ncbi:hypothetical protein JW859_02185 [bacterium]|nr:hypothetical protein [bacterium]
MFASLTAPFSRLSCWWLLLALLLAGPAIAQDEVSPVASAHARMDEEQCIRDAWPGRPVVNGVFLSHGYWQPQEVEELMAELESLGVDLVLDYALIPPEDDTWQWAFNSYLDSAEEHGIRVAFYLAPALYGATPETADEYLQRTVDVVAALKYHPAISAWYVHDEVLPLISGEGGTVHYTLTLQQMEQLYQRIKIEDPSRPQLNVWSQLPTWNGFNRIFQEEHLPYGRPDWLAEPFGYEAAMRMLVRQTCDWVLVDSYPLGAHWRGSDDGRTNEAHVAEIVRRAHRLRNRQQPLIFVYQAFSWAQYGTNGPEAAPFPRFEDMRTMLVSAWRNGADGAVAYSWFDLTKDIPGHNVPGREACLADLREVLSCLGRWGWPEDKSSLPYQAITRW